VWNFLNILIYGKSYPGLNVKLGQKWEIQVDTTRYSCIGTKYGNIVQDLLPGVSKWAGTRYFYPSEVVYSTGRNYWTPPKLAVVKTQVRWSIGLWNIIHKKLMITSIAEFSHSNRTTASRPSWWDIPCFKNNFTLES
jgi:hypothetical protein